MAGRELVHHLSPGWGSLGNSWAPRWDLSITCFGDSLKESFLHAPTGCLFPVLNCVHANEVLKQSLAGKHTPCKKGQYIHSLSHTSMGKRSEKPGILEPCSSWLSWWDVPMDCIWDGIVRALTYKTTFWPTFGKRDFCVLWPWANLHASRDSRPTGADSRWLRIFSQESVK